MAAVPPEAYKHHWGPLPAPASLVRWLSPGFQALLARIEQTPVPAGGYEANPQRSAPEWVEAVRAHHDLSEAAAALYLQTLALAAPTKKAVQLWNGWSTPQYKQACAELAAAELLLEAKRARAGRAHFLPGGWEAGFKAPDLPLETWKLPLYGIERGDEGELIRPLRHVLPLEPLHALFEQAWARVLAGDAPAYEKVQA